MKYFIYNSEDGLILYDNIYVAIEQVKLDIEYFVSLNEDDIVKSVCAGTIEYIVNDENQLVPNLE